MPIWMLQLKNEKILRSSDTTNFSISSGMETRKTMTSVETFMETGSEVQAYLIFFCEHSSEIPVRHM